MKISVSTDGKDVVVEMSKEKGERIFNKIVAMLLQPDTEDYNPESHIAPKQEKKSEIPYKVGVYCPCGNELKSVKKAVRSDRERPVSEMLLMMFRSANRDMVRI